MSGSLNKVILMGHVGQDPTIQTFNDGNKMAKLSICTTEKWTNKKNSEKVAQTEWHKVVVHVQSMMPYIETWVKKGSHVYVEGILKNRPFNKDGVEKVITEVHVKGFNHTLMTVSFPKGSSESSSEGSSEVYYGNDDLNDF